jgi:hypothetical protein
LLLSIQQHGSITIKTYQRTIWPSYTLARSDHNSVKHLAFLDPASWNRFLDCDLNNVTHSSVSTLGTAKHLDAHYAPCTTVICDIQISLRLNHVLLRLPFDYY